MTDNPIKKNTTYTVDIVDLTHEGLGVAKIEGFPIFIENTLPGEKVEIGILKVGKKFGYGKVLEIKEKSPDRVEFENQQLTRTGIAPLQHMAYSAQLKFKEKQVENVMKKIAKMEDVTILPIVGMEQPFGYRNKAQIPVRKVKEQLETGFFRKNSHDLVPIEEYKIQDPAIDQAIIEIRDILRRFNVKPYNEEEHVGNLRNIMVRRGYHSHEMMVVFVTRTEKLFQHEKIVAEIVKAVPEVVSVYQNINPDRTNVLLGKESKLLYGKPFIKDTLMNKTYHISPSSFFQVNSQQAESLYTTAINFADLKPEDRVIDAYCGIGTITLSLADQVKKVYGIEVVKEAIRDAEENAQLNHISNAEFIVGKAETVLKEMAEEKKEIDILMVDPPRKGLAANFVEATLELLPEKIVYISCNPATMARDCGLLCQEHYQIKKIQPVDMFPQTYHVETVALLQRQ